MRNPTSHRIVALAFASIVGCSSQPDASTPGAEANAAGSPFDACVERAAQPYPHFDRTAEVEAGLEIEDYVTSTPSLAYAPDVVDGMRKSFDFCYQRARDCDPNMRGSARLVAKIDENGKVGSVVPSRSSGLSAFTLQCLGKVVRSRAFEKPASGVATVSIPIPLTGTHIARGCAQIHPKPYPEFREPKSKQPPPTPPDANPLAPTTTGGTVGNALEVVAGMAPAFRRCYQHGLSCDPEMKGGVRITARVDAVGRVSESKPTAAGGLSQGVIDCVAKVVASRTFAKPQGGGATLVIPVSFFPTK